jgi:hypothetical protein
MSENKHRTKEQMAGALRRIDDPWGISWRAVNMIRRFDARRTARFVDGWLRGVEHKRPVMIIAMPRAGTTFLFHLLRESSQLGSLGTEGHNIWRRYHHPRRNGWHSDVVGAGQIAPGERRFVNAYLHSFVGGLRVLEKTADNCVRTSYLLELFPDATFIVIKRDPCDVLNSYINMWRQPQGRFRSYYVPERLDIPGYTHAHMWCSTLIPGWRDLRSAPIPEIAFAQWSQYVDSIAAARTTVPAAQWMEIYFEDLIGRADETVRAVCSRIGIPFDAAVQSKLRQLLAQPVNALSPAGEGKWRGQNGAEIRDLLPRIAERAEALGYAVDAASGMSRRTMTANLLGTPEPVAPLTRVDAPGRG